MMSMWVFCYVLRVASPPALCQWCTRWPAAYVGQFRKSIIALMPWSVWMFVFLGSITSHRVIIVARSCHGRSLFRFDVADLDEWHCDDVALWTALYFDATLSNAWQTPDTDKQPCNDPLNQISLPCLQHIFDNFACTVDELLLVFWRISF